MTPRVQSTIIIDLLETFNRSGSSKLQHRHSSIMAATSAQSANIGFDFSNYARNEFLGAKLGGQPRGELPCLVSELTSATSTGTTIVGLKFGGGDSGEEEGICLGADTRATGGAIVADKNCEKVC